MPFLLLLCLFAFFCVGSFPFLLLLCLYAGDFLLPVCSGDGMAPPGLFFYTRFLPDPGSIAHEWSHVSSQLERSGTGYGPRGVSLSFSEFSAPDWMMFPSHLMPVLSLSVLFQGLWTVQAFVESSASSHCQLASLWTRDPFWPTMTLTCLPRPYEIAIIDVIPLTWRFPILERAPLLASTSAGAFKF